MFAGPSRLLTPIIRIHRVHKPIVRFLLAERKRFYKQATISRCDDGYEVLLDQRKLKTPLLQLFVVPSEPLAQVVSTEWNAQDTLIVPSSMHITSLCNTAIDNPHKRSKHEIVENVMQFLDTDTVCFRDEDPPELAELQKKNWDPVLEWFATRFQVEMSTSSDFSGPNIPAKTKEILRNHLNTYGWWPLIGIENAVETVKSFVIALATIDRKISVNDAIWLGSLEQQFQVSQWGSVEWAHDAEKHDLTARLAAANLYVQMTTEDISRKHKAIR